MIHFSVKNVSNEQTRDGGMALVLLSLLLYLATRRNGFLAAALALHVLNMIRPRLYAPFAAVWFEFSHLLGTIVSKGLLTAVYFVVVTPTGALRRVMGKDPLRLRAFKRGRESVMESRSHVFAAADLEKPY